MSISLYEISNTMKMLENYLDEDEIDQETYQNTLDLITTELQSKSTSLIHVIKNIESNDVILDNEIKRLKSIKDKRAKNLSNLKEYIQLCMENIGTNKIETPIGNFSLRKSESVNIFDETKLPSEFTNTTISIKPDKVKIKEAIKEGNIVNGCEIVSKNNLNIK